MTNGTRDLGNGLNQEKLANDHWRIEGYDVYTFAHWEGTHTSRGAHIEKDGQEVGCVGNISEARQWIRQQLGRKA